MQLHSVDTIRVCIVTNTILHHKYEERLFLTLLI